MKQEEAAQVFRNYFSYINRPGAKDLLAWIESNGFYEAPASKGHHGARPGGLAETFYKRIQAAFVAERRGRKTAAVPAI